MSLFELAVGFATVSAPLAKLAAKMFAIAGDGAHADAARLEGAAQHVALLAEAKGGGYVDLLARVQKQRANSKAGTRA